MNHGFKLDMVWILVLTIPFLVWHIRAIREAVSPVVLQIILGFVLGPVILGSLSPGAFTYLFPGDVLVFVLAVGGVAVKLFAYITGLHIHFGHCAKGQIRELVVISLTSTFVPFAVGVPVAYILGTSFPSLVGEKGFLVFVLAMAIAVSVTALPVLSAILHDMKEADTPIGRFVLSVAVSHDALLWIGLASLLTIMGTSTGHEHSPPLTIIFAITYVAIMFLIVQPWLLRSVQTAWWKDLPDGMKLTCQTVIFLTSGTATDWIGIHFLTGAVLAGAIWPWESRRFILKRVENFTLALLVPLFFVSAGLKATFDFGLIEMWVVFLVMTMTAYVGQFVGTTLVLRYFIRRSWQESCEKGVWLTCKGIAELVVLSMMFNLGAIGPQAYAGMVMMALLTTGLTKTLVRKIRNWNSLRNPEILENVIQTKEEMSSEVYTPMSVHMRIE